MGKDNIFCLYYQPFYEYLILKASDLIPSNQCKLVIFKPERLVQSPSITTEVKHFKTDEVSGPLGSPGRAAMLMCEQRFWVIGTLRLRPDQSHPGPGNLVHPGEIPLRFQLSFTYFAREIKSRKTVHMHTRSSPHPTERGASDDRGLTGRGVVAGVLEQILTIVCIFLCAYYFPRLLVPGKGCSSGIKIFIVFSVGMAVKKVAAENSLSLLFTIFQTNQINSG